jgi:hypothetical protein
MYDSRCVARAAPYFQRTVTDAVHWIHSIGGIPDVSAVCVCLAFAVSLTWRRMPSSTYQGAS